MIFEERDIFVPEGFADALPVFLVFLSIDKLDGIEEFHMNKAYNKPDIESPLILVPALRIFLQGFVLVPKSIRGLLFHKLGINFVCMV